MQTESQIAAERVGRVPRGHLFVDRDLIASLGTSLHPVEGSPPIDRAQIQAASLDLRLGPRVHRVRAGFLPGSMPIEERLAELSANDFSLEGEGAILERGLCYLVKLEERLELPTDVRATFNPRSSTGRCDVFTRVLVPGHPRFNETPPGYRGELWLEIAPLSFPMRFRRGDRLAQVRLQRGQPALSDAELRRVHRETPLCYRDDGPIPEADVRFDGEGGIELCLGLAERDPCGWRAAPHTDVVTFGAEGAHDPADFWEPVHAPKGRCVLSPGGFYIFASRERVCIPPHLAAEMLPVDVDIGELRNNYAGFFDNGFGWTEDTGAGGTPAVLEVRAHDVPFLVEDGQVFFRLRYFRTNGTPDLAYGAGRESKSYRNQDLTLARTFRRDGA